MDHTEIEAELALSREAARRNGDAGLRVALLKQVEPLVAAFADRWPTATELLDVSSHFGIDAANLFLEEIARRMAPNRLFLDELNRQMPVLFRRKQSDSPQATTRDEVRKDHSSTEICIVESNESVQSSGVEWGGHVETWRTWVREAGFTTDRITTNRSASVFENARSIRDHLQESHHNNRILVSVGRGSVEVLAALSEIYRDRTASEVSSGSANFGVRAWVNVAGPVAPREVILNSAPLKRSTIPFRLSGFKWSWPNRGSGKSVGRIDLTSSEYARLGVKLTTVSVVGLATLATVPLGAKRKWLDLAAKVGPNDGVFGAKECMLPGSYVVPVSGLSHASLVSGDHTLKPWLVGVLASLDHPGRGFSRG